MNPEEIEAGGIYRGCIGHDRTVLDVVEDPTQASGWRVRYRGQPTDSKIARRARNCDLRIFASWAEERIGTEDLSTVEEAA